MRQNKIRWSVRNTRRRGAALVLDFFKMVASGSFNLGFRFLVRTKWPHWRKCPVAEFWPVRDFGQLRTKPSFVADTIWHPT